MCGGPFSRTWGAEMEAGENRKERRARTVEAEEDRKERLVAYS